MIKSEEEYQATIERIEILLQNSDNIEICDTKEYIELNPLSYLVADYEERTYINS